MNDTPAAGEGVRHELPAGVHLAQADVGDDPEAAEARGALLMTISGEAILEGVERGARPYARQRATAVLDAWGHVSDDEHDRALDALDEAATRAAARVLDELRALYELDAADQRRTPLEVVRTVRREPSEVLAALGVPSIVRDAFEERSLPDDSYGLAPRTLADLGDDELGAMQLTWGVGKATVLRARAARAGATRPADNDVENLLTAGGPAARVRRVLGTAVTTGRRTVDEVRARLGRARGDAR
jgi:hypothetical protein